MMWRLFLVALLIFVTGQAHAARDAAFVSPSQGNGSSYTNEAIGVEPKNEIDMGETALSVGRRTTLFFVNRSAAPVDIKEMAASGDDNVRATIVDDDCTRQGKITPSSRCSVTAEVMPVGAGPWTAEILMTHTGSGRITRVKLSGKTSGSASADKRDPGLSLSTKDVKPIDFATVDIGTGQAVRSALMINDSGDPIKLVSIEVIAPENGLQKLDQGCEIEQELKPGESCPITLLWKPEGQGNISTDLIIRHTGPLGFVVIPVRGNAKEGTGGGAVASGSGKKTIVTSEASNGKPSLSPTADELEKALADHINPVSTNDLSSLKTFEKAGASALDIHLIGTVGNRAVIYLPDGTTAIVALGENIPLSGTAAVLTNVMAREAEILVNGQKRVLPLEVVAALTSRAAARGQQQGGGAAVDGAAEKGKGGAASASVPVMDKVGR